MTRSQETSNYLVVWKCGRKTGKTKLQAEGAFQAAAKVRIKVAREMKGSPGIVRIVAVAGLV